MRKSFILFLTLFLLSFEVSAAGTLPFVASFQSIAESMQGAMFWIAVVAGIAWALYSIFGDGQGMQTFLNYALVGAIGLNIATVIPVLFGGAAAGALLP